MGGFSRLFIPLPNPVKLFSNLLKVFLKSLILVRENDQNNNPFVEKVRKVSDARHKLFTVMTRSFNDWREDIMKVFHGQSVSVLRLIHQQLIPICHAD